MTVSEQIISVLDELCKRFGIAIDWTEQNVVPYIKVLCGKLIKYEIITSTLLVVLSIAILVGIVFAIIWSYKKLCDEGSDLIFPISIFSVLLGATMVFTLIFNVQDIIRCLVFPEMHIFEYIRELANVM